MAIIELTGLSKRFGDVTALEDVSLSVEEGEVFGFLGPNGAGKSTTINVLLDFVRPTAGQARVFGLDAQADSEEIRRRIGVLPDGYHVYDRLTGLQHVAFAIDSKGTDDDPMAILERVGIADAADRPAGGYSKGMKQRLILGMALVGEPELLVLDEPTTGLDPNGAREIRDIVREEVARGATVFFSSHILEQVEAVADRVAILRRGELVAVDTIDNLRASVDGGARLKVTLDRPFEGDVESIERIPGVSGVVVDGSLLTVTTEDASKTDVLYAIEAMDYDVRDFDTDETSLEELFVAFTDAEEAAEDDDVPVLDEETEVAQ